MQQSEDNETVISALLLQLDKFNEVDIQVQRQLMEVKNEAASLTNRVNQHVQRNVSRSPNVAPKYDRVAPRVNTNIGGRSAQNSNPFGFRAGKNNANSSSRPTASRTPPRKVYKHNYQ